LINFHPHLHFLVTEGGVDAAGVFHLVPRLDDSRLAEIFAREVLHFLVRKELLSPEWAERILSWRHTGFSVHSLVRARTKSEAERVGKYMIRPLLSLERLSFMEPEGKVGYRHGQGAGDQETMDYKGQVTVRYRTSRNSKVFLSTWKSARSRKEPGPAPTLSRCSPRPGRNWRRRSPGNGPTPRRGWRTKTGAFAAQRGESPGPKGITLRMWSLSASLSRSASAAASCRGAWAERKRVSWRPKREPQTEVLRGQTSSLTSW